MTLKNERWKLKNIQYCSLLSNIFHWVQPLPRGSWESGKWTKTCIKATSDISDYRVNRPKTGSKQTERASGEGHLANFATIVARGENIVIDLTQSEFQTGRFWGWSYIMVLRKKSKTFSLAHTLNRSPHSLRYGRRRKARASPRRGGEPRNSVIRALGGSRANTLAVASPLGESPNYVVLPRGGGRRPPGAASHRTCMGVGPFFFGSVWDTKFQNVS